MKNIMWFFVLLFFSMVFPSTNFAASTTPSGELSSDSTVYETMKSGENDKDISPLQTGAARSQSSSIFPLFLKFILSFLLVIGLLLLLLRYLTKRNKQMQANGPILSLGGQMLGNNRSVQVLLIGQTIYIVGVGEDVHLIREIPHGEEYKHLLESFESQADAPQTNLLKNDSVKWNSIFQKHLRKINAEMEEEKRR